MEFETVDEDELELVMLALGAVLVETGDEELIGESWVVGVVVSVET